MIDTGKVEREEYGHKYRFETDSMIPRWKSIGEGNQVSVTPPTKDFPHWRVWVPHMEAHYDFSGEDAEKRAFGAAALFITQKRSSRDLL